jgi:DNA-binding response OmpR family regulator
MTQPQVVTQVDNQQRIMVVDDMADTRFMLKLRLQRQGYRVCGADSGRNALALIQQEGLPHLVILDIVMPDMDGFTIAEELHRLGNVPLIFLSALSDIDTKVRAITQYAEDYVTKPFAFAELIARINRVLTRVAPAPAIVDERLYINFVQQYVIVNQQMIGLTPIENRLLKLLYKHRGHILSTDFLLVNVWGAASARTTQTLWLHIHRLRTKIELDPEQPRYIITVQGKGYSLPQRHQIELSFSS